MRLDFFVRRSELAFFVFTPLHSDVIQAYSSVTTFFMAPLHSIPPGLSIRAFSSNAPSSMEGYFHFYGAIL